MIDTINKLFEEHKEHYISLTRLLITLSLAYIMFISGVSSSENINCSLKVAVILQALSLGAGLWLQRLFIKTPLVNSAAFVKHAIEQAKTGEKKGFWPKPPPSQEWLFRAQWYSFIAAFVISTINVVLR